MMVTMPVSTRVCFRLERQQTAGRIAVSEVQGLLFADGSYVPWLPVLSGTRLIAAKNSR